MMVVPPLSSTKTTAMMMPRALFSPRAPFAIGAPITTQPARRSTRWSG